MRTVVAFVLPAFLAAAVSPAAAADARVGLSLAEAEALVREISGKVEELRGLKFKTPVTVKIIDGATAREAFKSKIPPEAEEDLRHTRDAYVQLGLVPRSADLVKGFLDLAEKDVLGFYEDGSKTFYVLDHVPPEEVRGVMAHELTHALEDQNYDLAALHKNAADGDNATAIAAVVEGSATVVMLAFLSREEGHKKAKQELEKGAERRAERLRIAPSFTQRSLLLPYVLGFTFLLRGKPWEWVWGPGVYLSDLEEAYKHPPCSTRQILHPEQYWIGRGRTAPAQRLTLPDLKAALGPGWSKATEGSIGELGLAVLTGSNAGIEFPWALLPSHWTNQAATGTVGDVYQHYVNGDRRVTVLLTRWETERDAEEFERALVSKGKYYVRYGTSYLVIVGDIGERAEPVAIAAFQGAKFWTAEEHSSETH